MAGRPTYTGGRTTYDGRHAVTGERHTYTGQSTTSPAKKSGGGGILGALKSAGHFVADKTERAARDVKGIPGGLYQVGKAPILDTVAGVKALPQIVEHPGRPIAEHAHVGAHSTAVGKAVASSTKTAVEHPLRDPFQTVTALLPVANTVLRGGELATGADITAPRVLRSGGKETPLIRSRSATGRTVQRGYDRTVQKALDKSDAGKASGRVTGRVAAHGQKRIGGALNEEGRIAGKMRAAPASMLDRAAVKLSKVPGKRRVEQAALELTSAQTSAEEAARYHLGQAQKGVNVARNEAVAKLYQRVADRGLVHVNESKPAGSKVYINPAETRLAKVDAALSRVQSTGDEVLVDKNVREPGALETRRNAPAQIRAGAKYEKPTPAKQGVVSQVLKRERVRLASLERRHSEALAKDAESFAKRRAAVDRLTATEPGFRVVHTPMGEAAARAKLDALDAHYEEILKKFTPEVHPYSPAEVDAETKARNTMRGRMAAGKKPSTGKAIEGRRGGGSKTIKTVNQEVRDLAESKLHDIIQRYPDHPVAQGATRLIAERQQLQDLLNRRAEAAFSSEKPPSLPTSETKIATGDVPKQVGGPSVPLDNPYRERIVTLGHAIEEQRGRVRAMEKRATSRVKPTGIIGGNSARPGRGFVSYKASEKKIGKAEASSSPGPVVGAAKSPLTTKTFTGRSIEQGFVPKEVTGSASRHFRQILRFINTDEARKAALETGSDVRRSPRDILVRIPDETAKPLSAEIQQALGREASTVDKPADLATEEGLQAAHRAFLDRIIPGRADGYANEAGHGIGTPAPDGYRWVDQGALGDLLKPPRGPRGRVARTADSINSAITSATVYFKVGHIGTRVFTNAATNIIQGSAGPRQIGRSAKLWDALGEEQRVRALAAAGQHGFAALPHEGTNLAARVATKGAQWWAKHVDAPFRFNSLAYELRKVGYTKPTDFGRALDALETGGQGLDAGEWAKVSTAARRADREAISYDRLNDFEKRYITRAVWFYPWIKGSTLFTVRTLIEHPYKAGALGQLGAYGHQVQQQTLGDTPSYEAGLIALTGGRNPLTTDFSTFSPFATAADVVEAPVRPGALAGFLNPAAGVAGQLAYGLNQYGSTSDQPYLDALKALAASTPEQQIAEAYAGRNSDQSGRMFPKSPGGSSLRFLLGPATPRRVNRSALAKAAARERSGRR